MSAEGRSHRVRDRRELVGTVCETRVNAGHRVTGWIRQQLDFGGKSDQAAPPRCLGSVTGADDGCRLDRGRFYLPLKATQAAL